GSSALLNAQRGLAIFPGEAPQRHAVAAYLGFQVRFGSEVGLFYATVFLLRTRRRNAKGGNGTVVGLLQHETGWRLGKRLCRCPVPGGKTAQAHVVAAHGIQLGGTDAETARMLQQ